MEEEHRTTPRCVCHLIYRGITVASAALQVPCFVMWSAVLTGLPASRLYVPPMTPSWDRPSFHCCHTTGIQLQPVVHLARLACPLSSKNRSEASSDPRDFICVVLVHA